MKICGKTKVVGIFGDPIEQTISPYMHNAAFESLGLEYVYVAFRVTPEKLKEAVHAVKAMGMPGINVTIPHKERVLEFLDSIDEEAKAMGAVNVIVNRDNRLVGYNTDGRGYLLSLSQELSFEPKGKNIIVVGAGGSARAIVHSILRKNPKSLVIANRTEERALKLADESRAIFKGANIKATSLDITGYAHNAHLLVNTTSAGMSARKGTTPIVPLEGLSKNAIVSDIVYKPLDTPLIKEAILKGLKTHKGLGMLVCQGALSFELWTGRTAPLDTMRFAAIQSLGD